MTKIEEQIIIQVAPATLFNLCHDLARWPEWDELVSYVELLSPAPLRKGSLLRVDSGQSAAAVYTYDAEMTEYHFPIRSALRVLDAATSSPFVSGKSTWSFDSVSGGTRFSLTWEYRPRGILGRLKNALGRAALTRRAIQRSLQNLKDMVEAEAE